MLLEKGINVDKVDNFGNTSLWKATFEARGKNYDMIPLLLSYNANFNFKNNYGISPLDFAKEIGDKKLISFFSPARPVAD